MNRLNACGKKKPSGCYNRKKAKESAQKNASVIAKIPKLINYFTIQGATKVTSILIYKLLLILPFVAITHIEPLTI